MTRYVSLACDNNPAYSTWAPIMTRLWRRLGYTPIVFMHNEGWTNPLGNLITAILEEEHRRGDTTLVRIPRIGPLSIANTMRCSRLAASAMNFATSDDFILTADIDMAPLSRTFFDRNPAKCWVLRGDMYGSFAGASQKITGETRGLIAGMFRFPLCYIGLPVHVWRTILPIEVGDPERSLRHINHGLGHDAHDHDEASTSARLLLSKWAAGTLYQVDGEAVCTLADGSKAPIEELWVQGVLHLIPMTDWPKGQPKRMMLGGMAKAYDPNAIDWHIKATGRWIGDALEQWWPEEKVFLDEYWPKVCGILGVRD